MKLIKYIFFTVFCVFALSFGLDSYSQPASQQEQKIVKIDKSYLQKLSAAKLQIKNKLETTDDPSERNKLILKLNQIDSAYYNPSVRTELIRKTRPGYASRVAAYNSLSERQKNQLLEKEEAEKIAINPQIRGGLNARWDNIPEWEKKIHCKESVKECFSASLLKCRFVLDRCYEYVDKETFKKVRSKFSAPLQK